MIVGMDFGTTNSGMALFDGEQVRLLPLDPSNRNPEIARTALYITNNQDVSLGREAIDLYFDQNIGRPVKMKKVWVGEVEVYGADMFYIADVYAWIDALSPGRLFLSIKSGLRDPDYQGTVVGQRYYSLENLVASYLSLTRLRAERLTGHEIREVVLGRPVRFSTDPEADALAQGRLLEAAFRAGYERVYLQHEPVAAAYAYAAQAAGPQNILVFDFGGGTLDITVMHLGAKGEREVLASGGLPIAGDIFDKKLVRAKLPSHFGEGSHYGPPSRRLPLPKWVFDVFSDWQRVFELQTLESREFLREIASTSDDKQGVEALISLVTNNYSLQMFDVVEEAKRKLSTEMAAMIRLQGPDFRVTDLVTRAAFEKIIMNEIRAIDSHLEETVKTSGLTAEKIDAVVRTGGSSNIPAFRYMLMDKFGREKVQAVDIFSSVSAGLGIIAQGIHSGEIPATAFSAGDQPQHSDQSPRENVASVNLKLLQKRMASREGIAKGESEESAAAILLLGGNGGLRTYRYAKANLAGDQVHPLPDELAGKIQSPTRIHYLADTGKALLMITSSYRFLLTTVEHLLDLHELGMEVKTYYQLQENERICSVGYWEQIRTQPEMLLLSSKGYIRTYDLDRLVEMIEGPSPLKFDQPLPGLPMMVGGVNQAEDIVVISDSGRAVRYQIGELPVQGLQAFNRGDDERLAGALITRSGEELVAVTESGFGRRLVADTIAVPDKSNSRGRIIISRRPVIGLAGSRYSQSLLAYTSEQVIPFQPAQLPLDGSKTTKSYPIKELREQKRLLGLLLT